MDNIDNGNWYYVVATDILNNHHLWHQMKSQWRASQLEDKGKVALKSLYLLFSVYDSF